MSDQLDDSQAQPSPTPIPRGQRFSDPQCDVVWAAIRALDEAAKHDLLSRLGEHLAVSEVGRDGPQAAREARAVAALREASSLHAREGSPGSAGLPVAIYRALRSEHPERGWPPDGSIRRWLGGNWNDALRRAGLGALPEADITLRPLGSALSKQEAITAVQACAEDLGEVPTFSRYVGWVRRPDVRRREGRRPASQPVFDRLWPGGGAWFSCLREAGLLATADGEAGVSGSSGEEYPVTPGLVVRPSAYRYQPEQVIAALTEAAKEQKDPLRSTHYTKWRARQLQERPGCPLPSYAVVIRVLGPSWNEALAAAGLPTPEGTPMQGREVRQREAKPRYTDRQVEEVLRRAYEQLGDPFTSAAYARWRTRQLEEHREQGDDESAFVCPTVDTLRYRYGPWARVVKQFIPEARTNVALHEQIEAEEQRP